MITRNILLVLLIATIVAIVFCDAHIRATARRFLYSDPGAIPKNRVGVLLGTSQHLRNGRPNPYFEYRLDAAVELVRAGAVDFLIASGDNGDLRYNEPVRMRNELIRRGVPENVIYLDYAGFRTLDSVIRSQKIFGQNRYTIISQRFHNERAVYIARHFGIEAIGYNARDVSFFAGLRTRIREYFARVRAIIDLHLTKTQPRFLGDTIDIE